MEVVVQSPSSPTMDNFDFMMSGATSSTYLSAPSSPKRFGEYYLLSAPSSPSRLSQLYGDFDYLSSSSTVPIEAAANNNDEEDEDENGFAFFVDRESNKSSRSAEELFDGGKIKPLNMNESRGGGEQEQRRGRDRDRSSTKTTLSSSNSGRRVTRSLSPYRKSSWELEQKQQQQQQQRSHKEEAITATTSSNTLSSSSSSKGSKRWSLKDLLLFRSASEGRGSSKDPLRKYSSVGYKKNEEVVKGSRRKGNVSAHELHYAMKKAESEDMKKRTFLPYRQGILGRLAGFGL